MPAEITNGSAAHFITDLLRNGGELEAKKEIGVGLPLGCSRCVLPVGYAGAEFINTDDIPVYNFCLGHQEPDFLGEDRLFQDLNLSVKEKVGITVSGGKDSLFTLMWFINKLGPDRVVGFHHHKAGLMHSYAEENLNQATQILGCQLITVEDHEMLPRFQQNLHILMNRPDPAMIRVALCAGCRFGISGLLFQEGKKLGITKFISSASYLELAPFKAALMSQKGKGNEHQGLLVGLDEQPGYNHDDNIEVILREDQHCHKSQLAQRRNTGLYQEITYLDFDTYFSNIPDEIEAAVTNRLDWKYPGENKWHFDCVIETFKDVLYYGLLGYTETDYYLSAMVRHHLITREEAIDKLVQARKAVIQSQEAVFILLGKLGVADLSDEFAKFYISSPYLSENIS